MQAISEGKTKRVVPIPVARFVAKDDITAGDGKKHDVLIGKAELSTRTTCNVFSLLERCGIETAFIKQDSPRSFIGHLCNMVPIEVVARREAHGSYLKRNPGVEKGTRFSEPLVEMYLKTTHRTYQGHSLPCDDPMMVIDLAADQLLLYRPDAELTAPFLTLGLRESFGYVLSHGCTFSNFFETIATQAVHVFLVLEDAWKMREHTLVDMKLEFGMMVGRKVVAADVIDNDSWRLLCYGSYVDKQQYRDGAPLESVLQHYKRVADATDLFRNPDFTIGVYHRTRELDFGHEVGYLVAAE